ncbi:MAG TPA: hypothetical protein VJW76_15835 [Verrucomicrobiae bacterium]|nr:hypothetical protein [Verrucomicrobiae bacterium]
MEFLKNNYEKVILSVVLLGLAVAAALLPIWVSNEKRALEGIENQIITQRPKELKPLDLSTNEAALQLIQKPPALALVGEHNLFNPVRWQRRLDGSLFSIRTGKEFGPGALTITEISPLHTKIEFEGVSGTAENPQYRFKITREAERRAARRIPIIRSVSAVGNKNDIFILRDLKPKESPAEFLLEMLENKENITVTKEKPYVTVAGHLADLKYDPDKLNFANKRVGDSLPFAGDTNKIVAITETNVTVAATSNTKRTTISYKAAP